MQYRGFREMTTKHVMEIAKKSGSSAAIWPYMVPYRLYGSNGNKSLEVTIEQMLFLGVSLNGLRVDAIFNHNGKQYRGKCVILQLVVSPYNIEPNDILTQCDQRGGGGGQLIFDDGNRYFSIGDYGDQSVPRIVDKAYIDVLGKYGGFTMSYDGLGYIREIQVDFRYGLGDGFYDPSIYYIPITNIFSHDFPKDFFARYDRNLNEFFVITTEV